MSRVIFRIKQVLQTYVLMCVGGEGYSAWMATEEIKLPMLKLGDRTFRLTGLFFSPNRLSHSPSVPARQRHCTVPVQSLPATVPSQGVLQMELVCQVPCVSGAEVIRRLSLEGDIPRLANP